MCENNEKKTGYRRSEGLRGDGEAKWYVVHTYSGSRKQGKESISKRSLRTVGCRDLIFDVIVPTEDRVEVKVKASVKIKTRKMFPDMCL